MGCSIGWYEVGDLSEEDADDRVKWKKLTWVGK